MDFCLTNNSFIIFNSYPCILTARDAGYANLYIFNYILIGHKFCSSLYCVAFLDINDFSDTASVTTPSLKRGRWRFITFCLSYFHA